MSGPRVRALGTIFFSLNSEAVWNNKGVALDKQVRYDETIKAYDEAIRPDPNLALAWNNERISLSNLGKYDESIKAYDESIRLDPSKFI